MISKTIVIVDDDPLARKMLRHLFSARGWDVTEADDIETGYIAATRQPYPRWIVIDLWLGQRLGTELLSRLRAEAIPTRIAICSAETDAAILDQIHMLKPDLLVDKSKDFRKLPLLCEEVHLS